MVAGAEMIALNLSVQRTALVMEPVSIKHVFARLLQKVRCLRGRCGRALGVHAKLVKVDAQPWSIPG